MAPSFDWKKLADPENFTGTDKQSIIADEIMTEMVVGPLPDDFDVERVTEHFDKIVKEKYPTFAPYIFVVTDKRALGSVSLVVAFKHAVDIEETKADLEEVVHQEISECGENPARWPHSYTSLSDHKFLAYITNYQANKPR